jgi:uncharacterized membrane protein
MDTVVKEGKTLAIICYFTFIGLLIGITMNMEKRNEFVFFHARQMIGLLIMLAVSNISEKYVDSIFGTVLYFITVAAWFHSLLGAIRGHYQLIPYLGPKFQEWFKTLK